jgi:alcohol dehydrogenase class IV
MSSFLIRSLYPPVLKAAAGFMKDKQHRMLEGFGVRGEVGEFCRTQGYSRVLLIMGPNVSKLGLADKVLESLDRAGIGKEIFDGVSPDPTFSVVQAGKDAAVRSRCSCIIAIGGGSVLDTAKVVSGCVNNPEITPQKLVMNPVEPSVKPVPLIMIPTTAGTGAETTLGVVISEDETHIKHTGLVLFMNVVMIVLDSELTVGAPAKMTAMTGYDALSHGIEAYCSCADPKGDGADASLECVKMVFKYLPEVMKDPSDAGARQAMCRAAYLGGTAINRETLGYGHSFAHTIGSFYGVTHGEAMAIVLPYVLRYQKDVCLSQLAELAEAVGLSEEGDTEEILAEKFIQACEKLRDELGLRSHLAEIKKEDYPKMIANVFRDSITWAVPKVMTYRDAEKMFDTISGTLDVARNSDEKEKMGPVEKGVRAGVFGITFLYGVKKDRWVPFILTAAFHVTEYLVGKTADRK